MIKVSTYARIGKLLQKQPSDLSLCLGMPFRTLCTPCAGRLLVSIRQYFRTVPRDLVARPGKLQIEVGHTGCSACIARSDWLFFSKERAFCSNRHEVAYNDELSAMNRLMEFTARVGPPANLPIPPVTVPAMCNLVVERGCLKPTPPQAGVSVLFEAALFAGRIQFPSSSGRLIAFTPDSAARPEIAPITCETVAACRVQSKRSRRTPRSSAAKPRTKTAKAAITRGARWRTLRGRE